MYLLSETFLQNYGVGGDRISSTTRRWDPVNKILKCSQAESALRKNASVFDNRRRKALEETDSDKAEHSLTNTYGDISIPWTWALFGSATDVSGINELLSICDAAGIHGKGWILENSTFSIAQQCDVRGFKGEFPSPMNSHIYE